MADEKTQKTEDEAAEATDAAAGAPAANANSEGQTQQAQPRPARPTLSHMFGEMVWLLSQSPTHKRFSLEELNWFLLPPLRLEQYRIFLGSVAQSQEGGPKQDQGEMILGLALWAMFNKDAEKRFVDSVRAGKPVRLRASDWNSGTRLWMIDLIAPFATPENDQTRMMMADFMQRGLTQAFPKARDNMLRFFQQDSKTGERKIVEVKAEMRPPQPADEQAQPAAPEAPDDTGAQPDKS